MPITGLVITLSEDATAAAQAREVLSLRPELHLGESHGCRLPASAETAGDKEDKHLHNWLLDLPGVRFVDVVWAWIGEEGVVSSAPFAVEPPKQETAEDLR